MSGEPGDEENILEYSDYIAAKLELMFRSKYLPPLRQHDEIGRITRLELLNFRTQRSRNKFLAKATT